jgi:hypothetical protein
MLRKHVAVYLPDAGSIRDITPLRLCGLFYLLVQSRSVSHYPHGKFLGCVPEIDLGAGSQIAALPAIASGGAEHQCAINIRPERQQRHLERPPLVTIFCFFLKTLCHESNIFS